MQILTRLTIAALLVSLGCAGDVGDVDRTQPGKLRKSALEGEWYYRQTVVDVPFSTGVTFIGEQSLLERVRWEVSEDFLTAYRTYERVTGSEAPSELPGAPYQGAPVAAFRILKHFDVTRVYNEATGEQSNVIVENDFDRPWYDRAYVRVDWSTNLLANFDFLAGGARGLGVLAQPASYAVTDPRDPDAPVFAQRQGESWVDHRDPFAWGELASVDYFDLTLKLQVTPDTFDIVYDDGTVEQWPACWFYEYGPWDCASQTIKVRASFLKTTPRDYEPLYYPDNYIARDADGQAIRTMVDYDLGVLRRCNANEGPGCTPVRVPMFDWFGYFRTERETYDRDYEVTEEGRVYLINRHNLWARSRNAQGEPLPLSARQPKPVVYHLSPNFPRALEAAAQEVGGWWDAAFSQTVDSARGTSGTQGVFVVRPNSFAAQGGEVVDHGQRNGDLRYNHLYWVDDPQFEALLGYGPSAADPLTGEIIAADAYVYGGAIDSYAASGADVIDLMRGQLDESVFIEGENVGAAVAMLGRGPRPDGAAMRARTEHMAQRGLAARLREVQRVGRAPFRRDFDYAGSRLALGANDPRFDALWNSEMQLAFEARLGRKLSPERGGARLLRALERHRMSLARKAVCMRGFNDAAVLGLVNELAHLPRAEVVQRLRAYLFKSVAAHEVGHTLGLRHNFAGSTDALNFHDEYWDVRDPAARPLELPSTTEEAAGLREHAYSSIMDYGAKFNSDIRGLGKYDVAAIKFGYGQMVEAFVSPPSWEDHDVLGFYTLDQAVKEWTHYTDLPALFDSGAGDGRANMRARLDVPMQDVIGWLTLEPGAADFTDTLVPYKFCSDEYAGAVWDCDTWDEGADPYEIVSYATQTYRDYYIFDAFKRNRRYLDPLDHYYSVYARTMQPLARQYQLWLFDQWYKAGEWDWLHAQGTSATEDADWNLDPHGGLTRTAAAMTAVNFLGEVLATPEPGSYYTDPTSGVLTWWTPEEDFICEAGQSSSVDACSDLYVPLGEGRYAYSEFDAESGYYWYERVRVVGSFWDKLAAIETLADPTTYFLGVDDVANATQYSLGFNVAFPNAVEQLFGAIVNDDYEEFAYEAGSGGLSLQPVFESVLSTYGDTPAPDRVGPFVDPATNFTIALYALYYGMALLNANFDQSFNDGAKIWLEGSGEAFTPVVGATIATFQNPYNGRTYKAMQSPNPLAYSLGYEMVSRAETLAQQLVADGCTFGTASSCAGPRWELNNLIQNIEVVRGYYDVFGYAWF